MFGAWLTDVYRGAQDWSFDDVDLAEIARTGVRASFADDDVKAEILAGIDAWLMEPGLTPRPPPDFSIVTDSM